MRTDYGGIVYVEEEHAYGGDPPIYGSWQKDNWFEDGPGWATAAKAIAWGRRRAPFVYLRIDLNVHSWRYRWADGLYVRLPAPVELRHLHYSAGEAHRQQEEDEAFVRWPGASDRRDADVVDGYGGAVWLVQSSDDWQRGELIGYTARWETEHDGALRPAEVMGPAWRDELHEAIAWGRERAPYVLVRTAGSGYESAGAQHLAGLDIPRIAEFYEAEPTPVPEDTVEVGIVIAGSWEPKTFPIPEGLEPAGGLPPS